MKRYFPFLAVLVLLLSPISWSFPLHDLETTPTAEEDGDTINTFQITLTSSAPTLIDAGNSNNSTGVFIPTIRKRVIKNMSTSAAFVGLSTTTLLTSGFMIDAATGTFNNYQTYNSAAFYGMCQSTSCKVSVIEETTSIP